MDNLYLIKFSEKNDPHIKIRKCEIVDKYDFGYDVETGHSIERIRKWQIDNFNIGLNIWYDNIDEFTAYMWLSNNDRDSILRFKNEVLKIINNKIVKLNEEMQRFEKMKMLVGE